MASNFVIAPMNRAKVTQDLSVLSSANTLAPFLKRLYSSIFLV